MSESYRDVEKNGKPIVRRIKGKVRPVTIARIKELRIIKRDVRRRYIDMYQNVMNMYDSPLLLRFIQDFWTPTSNLEVNIIIGGFRRKTRNGQSAIFYDFIQQQLMFPDGVLRLSDVTIHTTWGDPGSRVVCSLVFKGTKTFDYPMAVATDVQEEEVEVGRNRNQETIMIGPISMNRTIRPIEACLMGTLTFHLDVNHYIERCVFQEHNLFTQEKRDHDKN